MVCQCDTYKLLCDVKTAAAVPGRVCMESGSEEDLNIYIYIYIYAGFTTIPSVHLTLSAGSVLWCDLSGRQESSNPWHSIVDAEHFRDLQADLGSKWSKWSQWSQWSMLEQCWTQCRTLRSSPFNSCFLVPGILKGGDFRCLQPLPQVLVNDVLDEANQRDRSVNVLGPVPWRD